MLLEWLLAVIRADGKGIVVHPNGLLEATRSPSPSGRGTG
jgi:hypothetical protein